jgi:hypothetical protein
MRLFRPPSPTAKKNSRNSRRAAGFCCRRCRAQRSPDGAMLQANRDWFQFHRFAKSNDDADRLSPGHRICSNLPGSWRHPGTMLSISARPASERISASLTRSIPVMRQCRKRGQSCAFVDRRRIGRLAPIPDLPVFSRNGEIRPKTDRHSSGLCIALSRQPGALINRATDLADDVA